MSDEGFLRRWARLKAQPEEAVEAVVAPAVAPAVAPVKVTPAVAPAVPDVPSAELAPLAPADVPLLTIADAAALTADSDFSGFVAKNVDAVVRRLAMKKLFADPHFHGHDGLDIYMGDYTLPSPVSAEMLAEMSHNKNLFARLDEVIDGVLGKADALVAADQMPAVDMPTEAPGADGAPDAPDTPDTREAPGIVTTPNTPEPPAAAPPPPDQEVA